jgi:hypothetical protein
VAGRYAAGIRLVNGITRSALLMTGSPWTAGAAVLDWHEFDYAVSAAIEPGDERVALLLRESIDGRKCWLQLDTGVPGDVLWHGPAADETAASARLAVGDIARVACVVLRREGTALAGTAGRWLGLRALAGHRITLD